MKVSLIAAVARNRVIGKNNALPWRLQEDLRFFRIKTLGHHVIMGRKCYESIGRPLPGRPNIVISRNPELDAPCPVSTSVEAALQMAREAGETEAFVIGGAEIYRLALPLADTFYLTQVLADVDGDVFFPEFDKSQWRISKFLFAHPGNEDNEYPILIQELTRTQPRPNA